MIVTEEAIAKGIRRIVAVTGAEAQKVSTVGRCVIYLKRQREPILGIHGANSSVAAVVRRKVQIATPTCPPVNLAEESHHHIVMFNSQLSCLIF